MAAEAEPSGRSEPPGGGPLAGCRVVVTRSVEDNRSLGRELVGLGAEVIAWPMTEVIEPADGGFALREAVAKLGDYRYVILTSTNGVRAVAAALGGAPWPVGPAVKPVGPVTAALAAEYGMAVDQPPEVATAQSLVEAMPDAGLVEVTPVADRVEVTPVADRVEVTPDADRVDGPLVLAPLAELAGDTVVAGLQAKGYVVHRVEAYRTVGPDDIGPDLTAGQGGFDHLNRVDALTFFSPSAVDRLVDLAGAEPLMAVRSTVCIGPATAARAAERGLVNIVVAAPHTEAGVVTGLITAFGET